MVKSGLIRNLFVTRKVKLFLFATLLGLSSTAFAQASGVLKFYGVIVDVPACSATLETSRGPSPRATVLCSSNAQMRQTPLVLRNGEASSNVAHAYLEQVSQDKTARSYSMVLSYR